jgi:hypothetical protein
VEIHAEDFKWAYVFPSRYRDAGQNHSSKMANKTFQSVRKYRYLGTVVKILNSICGKIDSRLNSGEACCYSVQNLLFYNIPSKNVNIKLYRRIVLPIVLYWCEI